MATKQLRELRHRYKAAYTTYMHCVQALCSASQKGEWPAEKMLTRDQQTFDDLAQLRQALLEALRDYCSKRAQRRPG